MFLHRARNANPAVLRSGMTENRVNCSDCGTLLVCFANAVGGNLLTSYLGFEPSFYLNPTCPIGEDKWLAVGLQADGSFRYHCVATEGTGALGDATSVYDSCLQLGTPDPVVFMNEADAAPANLRLSNGSQFNQSGSLARTPAVLTGIGDGALNGRPSDTAGIADVLAPHSEMHGINATYRIRLTAPAAYEVTRTWTEANEEEALPQGAGTVRVGPPPGGVTDFITPDNCLGFEIVQGGVPFVPDDQFEFTTTFGYDGEYLGALAHYGDGGRDHCNWNAGPFVPGIE